MKPKTVRSCEIVSKLYDADGKTLFDPSKIKSILAKKGSAIKDYAYIIHDADTYTAEDEKANPDHKEGTLKPSHVHLLLRFERNQPQQFADIGKWFGLEPNFVSKIHGKWEDALLYLAHLNAPEKHQYDPDEINANFDPTTILNHANDQKKLTQILSGILQGEIREYNKTLEIDNMMLVHHAREINEAFRVRADFLQNTQQDRNTEVIFITGQPGAGKTTLAKRIATARNLAYFVSSGSNDVMDGYAQQPCLILDDIRPDSLDLSDLLKLLDNHTASLVKSRYRNKFLNAELVILTSVLDLELFYANIYGCQNEPITQLKRRCGTYIQVFPDTIFVSRWDDAAMQYSTPSAFKNDILDGLVCKKPKAPEEVQQEISNLLPFLTPDEVPKEIRQLWENESPPQQTDSVISDEAFAALMHPNEEREPCG